MWSLRKHLHRAVTRFTMTATLSHNKPSGFHWMLKYGWESAVHDSITDCYVHVIKSNSTYIVMPRYPQYQQIKLN